MHTHTPALMIQGTSSNAGKSLLAAAMCRIFTQDGLNVAPFKSQNMALNSCVTPDGLEMGRAQAVQAMACRRPPDVRMNPVLLKPTSDTGSQVIVMGQPVGVMRVREYWAYKPQAFAVACKAYDELAAESDLMIIEGAGSPAEINLREHDMVNMTMARHARARVLLVGDIDRGGVFAALVGTMALLESWEQELIVGLLINKFRGDASLLPPALDFVAQKTGKPVLGVVPWVPDLNLPDEDSVSFKAGWTLHAGSPDQRLHQNADQTDILDVVLLDIPRISNFTDLDAWSVEPDVHLRIARSVEELTHGPGPGGLPHLIIIPGSKNTLDDLAHLRAKGLDTALLQLAALPDGPEIVGICGGLQMLGQRIHDPLGLEAGGSAPGLGLLPLVTTLTPTKTLCRAKALHQPTNLPVEGYEIHHGVTHVQNTANNAAVPCIQDAAGQILGWASANGRIWGTYLHGIFDADAFRRAHLDTLRLRHRLPPLQHINPYSLEPALDRLAATVREHVDMERLRSLLI